MLILGIDDAGRGPVIGPMILAGCLINSSLEDEFRKIGVKDSKKILPKKREILAETIKEKSVTFEITLTFPNEITSKNKEGTNLNTIEAIKTAEIINRINKGFEKIMVYVDCPSPNIKKWQTEVESYIENKENLEIHCEHKADVNHVACSAASILAKTTRDREIEKIKEEIGIDFGSGYPSDPLTCKFLKENSEKHKDKGIFRETWSTWKTACSDKKQKGLGEF
ncbi:ribonuclease HII [Candidatus Pacearchaeota archaeon]|nr:ribonuclease HII [Candidatus Pacearchaeota archaeon]